MTKSPRRDFHRATFTTINTFVQIVDELAKQDELAKAHANAPDILKNGRSVRQIILDDLMAAYIAIVQDSADADIPLSFYKQMMSARDDTQVDDATAMQAMTHALAKRRAGDKTVMTPEFLLLFPDSVPQTVSQNLIRNWVSTVRMLGSVMFDDDALNANQKSTALLAHVEKLNNEQIKKTKERNGALSSILNEKANDNDEEPDENGIVVHYAEEIGDIDEVMAQLVGLQGPKNQIEELRARVNYKMALKEANLLDGEKPSMDHYIFRGPPGTGKTTFGRLVGKVFKESGLLDSATKQFKGHVVEVSADSLCAGYVRQTGPQTRAVIRKALGGILFVDEAYTLFGTGNDFGAEALGVILRAMETHKDNLIVVFAGYPDKMDDLIKSNPGLTRRFKHTLNFDNFQMNELTEIFDRNLAARKKTITPEARDFVLSRIETIKAMKGPDFGNAGTIENIVDILINKLSLATEQDGSVGKVRKLAALGKNIPPKLKIRLTQITMEEAQKIELQHETNHNTYRIGFAP